MKSDAPNLNAVCRILSSTQEIFDAARREVGVERIKELREAAVQLHSEVYANAFFAETDAMFDLVEYLSLRCGLDDAGHVNARRVDPLRVDGVLNPESLGVRRSTFSPRAWEKRQVCPVDQNDGWWVWRGRRL